MPKFYLNVTQLGNYIYHRFIDDDGNVDEEYTDLVDCELFIPTKEPSPFKAFYDGKPLKRVHFGSIRDAKRWIDEHKEISNLPIHGNRNWYAQFIAHTYPQHIEWDQKLITVANIDIEVSMQFDNGDSGFPEPETAPAKITAITVNVGDEYHCFGVGTFTGEHIDGITHYNCKDEIDLITTFLSFWEILKPDIVTGWNIDGFDIPYLINRITKILGIDQACRLSPAHRFMKNKAINIWEKNRDGKKYTEYTIHGLAVNDMLALYKNYTFQNQEKYSLDHIARVELDEQKVEYDGTLDELYENDYNEFIRYNIHDTRLVKRLDEKHKLIALSLSVTYLAKIRHTDHFFQVRTWDAMIYNRLYENNVVVPPMRDSAKTSQYTGAVVFDPQIGLHDWVVSADLNSLYPSLIRQYNISPEMLITRSELEYGTTISNKEKAEACETLLARFHPERDKMVVPLSDFIEHRELDIHKACKILDISLAANGVLYSKKRQGVLGKLMEEIYEQRSEMKRKMIEAEKQYEKTKDPKYLDAKAMYKTMQMSYKVMLNSAYGALGNEHFRLFNVDMAESITISGQLSIQWIQRRINTYLNKILKTDDDYIVAGDTDSFYMRLGEFVNRVTKGKKVPPEKIVDMIDDFFESKIQPEIDSAYKDLQEYMNAYQQQMIMKREVIAERGIWRAKKNYALSVWDSEGVRYDKPKVKISGMEAVKSSTPEVCRIALKESIRIILQETERDLQKYVSEFRNGFASRPIVSIASPSGISDIDKWLNDENSLDFIKGTPYHVKGAVTYNRLIKKFDLDRKYRYIRNGEKIKYIPLKQPNVTHSTVIAWIDDLPPEFNLDKDVDYALQYEKSFLIPLRNITDKIGWQTVKKSTLF